MPTEDRPHDGAGKHRSLTAWLVTSVVSFEAFFLLFLTAGRFKGMPEFSWFPIDMTLFFLALSVGAAALLSSTRINVFEVLQDYGSLFFFAFLAWVLMSLLWSSYGVFNKEKTTNTIILLSWCFFGGYVFVADELERVRRFLGGLVAISLLLLLYWAYYRFILGVVDLPAEDEVNNYLVYGYHAQYVIAVLVAGSIASRGVGGLAFCMAGLIALFVIMLFIGGRGPLFFAVLIIPLACFLLLAHRHSKAYRGRFITVIVWLAIMAVVLQLLVLWIGPYLFEQLAEQMTTLGRFTDSLEQSDFGGSVSSRVDGQTFAIEYWMKKPVFGWGVGEFERFYPTLQYPHNLFLEILMEQGIVGFCLLSALIGLGAIRAWRLWPRQPDWVLIALILLFFTQLLSRATVQGFLPDERILFALLGMILGLGRRASVVRQ